MRRDDETTHLRILRPDERGGTTEGEVLRDVCRMVDEALRSRAEKIQEGSEGVEFDLGQMRARIDQDGLDADLSAIKVGAFFAAFTEFRLLQRLRRALQSRVQGLPQADKLEPEEG